MAELYSDTPWWTNLAAVLLTATVSILGTAYYFKRTPSNTTMGIPNLLKDFFAYMPHILLLFGVIADALTWEGVYAIPSGIGIISIFLNYGMKYFWDFVGNIIGGIYGLFSPTSVPPAPMQGGGVPGQFSGNYDGCEMQGFSALRNPYAPQTLVFTATVFLYYIFDLVNNRGWVKSSAAIVLFGVFYIAQAAVVGYCSAGPVVGPAEPNPVVKALMALAEGGLFGGVSYALIQTYAPQRLPSSSMSIFPRVNASQLSPGKNGTMVDSAGNPYVCLPNGQCIPDVSTTEARKNFADMAGENLGTGKAAVPADCPATSSTTTSSSSSR